MSKTEEAKTEGKTVAPKNSSGSFVWLVVPPLVAVLLVFGYWFVFAKDADLAEERIDTALNEGGCSPRQAEELVRQAQAESDIDAKAEGYELAMNCFLGHEDYASAQEAAINAEEFYEQAGRPLQAQQMNAAQQAHQLIIDYQNGIIEQAPRDENEELDSGDVI